MMLQLYRSPFFTEQSGLTTPLTDVIQRLNQVFNAPELTAQSLPLDVVENENEYVVKAAVPMVDPKSIQVNIRDRLLHIKLSRPKPELMEGERYLLAEIPRGEVERWLQFEKDISPEAKASYREGTLTLTIPKKHVQQSVPIQIEVA